MLLAGKIVGKIMNIGFSKKDKIRMLMVSYRKCCRYHELRDYKLILRYKYKERYMPFTKMSGRAQLKFVSVVEDYGSQNKLNIKKYYYKISEI